VYQYIKKKRGYKKPKVQLVFLRKKPLLLTRLTNHLLQKVKKARPKKEQNQACYSTNMTGHHPNTSRIYKQNRI
jgi:hypothetical protein